jgi:small-conductance mechanosensitive channel
MANFDEVQSMAVDQALREQNQQLRKQLEDMNAQMQALMMQLQGNMTAQSSQVSQEAQPQNQEQVIQPSAQATAQINIPQPGMAYLPQMPTPQAFVNAPQTGTMDQSSKAE